MATTTPQLWPIFICYRRVDGSSAARRLYEILDQRRDTGPDNQPIQLDVYLDETVPGVADWKAMHRPYLEKARALIVICTPGAKLNEGANDWVHQEIEWWLAHRDVAPILIDPLMEGLRYVPTAIAERWPDIQRIPLLEKEWAVLTGPALQQKADDLRRHVIGALLPSGAAIYEQELLDERQRALRLKRALFGVVALLGAVAAAGGYAVNRQRAAVRNEQVAAASLLDTRAASAFNESRLIDVRWELELNRRRDIVERLAVDAGAARTANLRYELQQLDEDIARLRRQSRAALESGRQLLARADQQWELLVRAGVRVERTRPEPPYVLSVELVNAGPGESILIHYGTPDDIKLIMINAGPRASFRASVAPRIHALSLDHFDGRPVPIELFIAGDRDEDKTGGLERLLSGLAEPTETNPAMVEIRGIWANIFRMDGAGRQTFRSALRGLIDTLKIPLNQPFDRHIVRPQRGRARVTLPGGLEIVVLGPAQPRVDALHGLSAKEARQVGGTVESLIPEGFKNVTLEQNAAPLTLVNNPSQVQTNCVPSQNARANAGGEYRDASVSNLASTILLFRFREATFLFTGDARGDLILEGLSAAGLLDENGRAAVDLMTIPHLGSLHNVTVDFFERVRASGYLFSGNGRFGNPQVGTVAALITARGCESYRMYFVNRDGVVDPSAARARAIARARARTEDPKDDQPEIDSDADETMGERLDAFFRDEERFNPNYRRVFRSAAGGSVIIDMLTPVRR